MCQGGHILRMHCGVTFHDEIVLVNPYTYEVLTELSEDNCSQTESSLWKLWKYPFENTPLYGSLWNAKTL